MTGSTEPEASFAAIDLGSNSFHMVIARIADEELQIVDRIKESVRLASGLDDRNRLDTASQERALGCLERFRQRIERLPASNVRAVGTNTLRKAKNGASFLDRARAVLGSSIEVIPGREEARLIYLGVAHATADDAGRRLVVDIGGGSTECIIGERFEPLETDSLYMGCVSFSLEFFSGGDFSRQNFKEAETAAGLELQSIEKRYRRLGWQSCVGASGTIAAIEQIGLANGWSAGGITQQSLKKLRKAMTASGRIGKLQLDGLQPDRAPVLAGGLAVLTAVFHSLGIESMTASQGALREGLLYDLLGRIRHEDVRDRTITAMCERYSVDRAHAERVERTALQLLRRVAVPWGIDYGRARQLLSWAAKVHEIGLAVSYSGYHKHGAYLFSHTDTPGFSRQETDIISAVVRGHRRKIPRSVIRGIPGFPPRFAERLCILLRLAVLINRSRADEAPPEVIVDAQDGTLTVEFYDDWLAAHPLTRADLECEATYLEQLGIELIVESK
jgi:exopolyphosphatase/guanosine-5'-triphosphate,3'-diphosphate pyrophosphatase